MPQKALKELGYTKPIYQTHGVSTMEFVRVGGKDVEGTVFPAGPVVVASLLPEQSPTSKAIGLAYIKAYEENNKTPFACVRRGISPTARSIMLGGCQGGAGQGQARHAGIPGGLARRGRDQRTSSRPTTASTPTRRPTIPASTSARAC